MVKKLQPVKKDAKNGLQPIIKDAKIYLFLNRINPKLNPIIANI